MKALHLTEDEIQEYALKGSVVDLAASKHAVSCELCRARVMEYEVLFTAIKQEPQAAFDFNLAELVIAQLPSPDKKRLPDFVVYMAVLALLIVGVAILYYFSDYIVSLFASIVPLFIYLAVTTVITLSILLTLDMYKTHQRKMRSLDFN